MQTTTVDGIEADGVSKATMTAFLTYRSISPSSRMSFLCSLLDITGSCDDDDRVEYAQMELLHKTSFESFTKEISTLHASPNSPSGMEAVTNKQND
eukprot:14333358-Ditylum_brightwellii.AAC.1